MSVWGRILAGAEWLLSDYWTVEKNLEWMWWMGKKFQVFWKSLHIFSNPIVTDNPWKFSNFVHIITKFNTLKSQRWNYIFSKKLRKIRKEVWTNPNLLVEFYIKFYEKSVKCFWLFAHTYKLHCTYKERIKVRLFKKFTENKELVTNWEPNLVAALQFLRFWEYFSLSAGLAEFWYFTS